MFDAPETEMLQRVRGGARVGLEARSRLTELHQMGAGKAFLPRVHGGPREVVFLNTAGGLTGGDRLSYALRLGPGAAAVAATQTAERAYGAGGGRASVRLDFTLGAGAALDWLPQETILYDRSGLDRHTRVEMTGDARLVWAEMLVLGRGAMGERVTGLDLSDRREVWRDGRLALLESVRMGPEALAPRAGLTGGARALAVVVLIAPGAEAALGAVRAALPGGAVEAGASAWDGRCVVRMRAPDGLPLKHAVAAVLAVMRRGAALPRVWQI